MLIIRDKNRVVEQGSSQRSRAVAITEFEHMVLFCEHVAPRVHRATQSFQ